MISQEVEKLKEIAHEILVAATWVSGSKQAKLIRHAGEINALAGVLPEPVAPVASASAPTATNQSSSPDPDPTAKSKSNE